MHRGLRAALLPPTDGFSPCNLSSLFISHRPDCLNPNKAFSCIEELCSGSAFLGESRRKAELSVHLLTSHPLLRPGMSAQCQAEAPLSRLPASPGLRVASIPALALGPAGGLLVGCCRG